MTAVYSHQLLCAPFLLLKCASLPAEFPLYVRDLGLHLSLAQPSLNTAVMFVPQEGRRVVPCPNILSDMRKDRGEAVAYQGVSETGFYQSFGLPRVLYVQLALGL